MRPILALSYQIILFRRNFRVYIETFKRDERAFQGKKKLEISEIKTLSLTHATLLNYRYLILFSNMFFSVSRLSKDFIYDQTTCQMSEGDLKAEFA